MGEVWAVTHQLPRFELALLAPIEQKAECQADRQAHERVHDRGPEPRPQPARQSESADREEYDDAVEETARVHKVLGDRFGRRWFFLLRING